MTIICATCGEVAKFNEADENMVPYMENGHYECSNPNCNNSGITDGTHEGNLMNGFTEVEKIIILEETPANNHGCSGFSVEIKVTGARTGIVVDERSCSHSCHGEWHWYEVGQELILPDEFSSWDEAAEYTENEGSFSNAGRTKLAPGEF